MMTGIDPRDQRRDPRDSRRTKRARAGFFIVSGTVVATILVQPGYQWVALAVGAGGAIAVAVSAGPSRRGRAGAFIGCGTVMVSGLFQPGWQWLPFAVGTVAAIAVAAGARRPGRRDRSSVLTGRGRDDDDRPAGAAAHPWRTLAVVSRLMPGPAGRRWLAEAESLLPEVAPAGRGAAIRSYLRSAPWLTVTMWAREVQRRARLGRRRPG